jgi:hypothetical protein
MFMQYTMSRAGLCWQGKELPISRAETKEVQ